MDWLKGLVDLAKLKSFGVIMAILALFGLLIWTNWKTSANHIDHSTEAIERNTEAIGDMKSVISANNEVLRAINQTLLIKVK